MKKEKKKSNEIMFQIKRDVPEIKIKIEIKTSAIQLVLALLVAFTNQQLAGDTDSARHSLLANSIS